MPITQDELSANAKGGTELQKEFLRDNIPPELLENVQLTFSRVRDLDTSKKQVLYLHDLPWDPESQKLADAEYRDQFDKFVFVSNWQLQMYNQVLGVPYSKSVVIRNAIEPILDHTKPDPYGDSINFIYHTTPHRGLEILVPTFIELCKTFPFLHLDVYSSFNIYGWGQRDEQYKDLIETCKDHPNISYHGSVSNREIRAALRKAHVFLYPSIWMETSCLALIEALSAKVYCIHPNFAALPETSGGLTQMYQWTENNQEHAERVYHIMYQLISNKHTWLGNTAKANQYFTFVKNYSDFLHNRDVQLREWIHLLRDVNASN